MIHSNIIEKVSKELSLPKELVENTYKAYWLFIRTSIEKLPLTSNLTQEEFNGLKTNINIPSLGKLNCTYSRYLGIKNRFSVINKIRNKNEH